MIKIFDKDTVLFESEEQFVSFDLIKSPFKEILKKEDYSPFSFQLSEEGEKIEFGQVFILQVNVKDSCSLICAFPLENFKRDELIKRVASLKSIKVIDLESSKNKTNELLKIIKEFNPYFAIYQEKNGFPLNEEELKASIKDIELDSVSFFYVKKDAMFDEPVVENKEEKKEKNPEDTPAKNGKGQNIKNVLIMDLDNIKKNKYHFLFLTISSFLFGFAASIGLCNALIGKLITILFFVCAGVGLFLDTYVYLDYFREKNIKDRLFIYSLLFNLFGIILSIGASLLFYYLDNSSIRETVGVGLVIGAGIGMTVGSVVLSIGVAYLVAFLEVKYKKPKASTLPSEPVEIKEDKSEEKAEEEAPQTDKEKEKNE